MVVGRVASRPDRLAGPRSNAESCAAKAHLMFHDMPRTVLALQTGSVQHESAMYVSARRASALRGP